MSREDNHYEEPMTAKEWVAIQRKDQDWKAGKASRYIRSVDVLKAGDRVFLVACVSWRDRRGNLVDSLRFLRAQLKRKGVVVCGHYKTKQDRNGYIGPRWEPTWICYVKRQAQAADADYIVGETTDRLIRHEDFESDNPQRLNLQATDRQLKRLAKYAGMPLVTLLDPDASPSEVRSYQRKRGQWAKGRRGGRKTPGWKKRRRQKMLPRVRLLAAQGESLRSIESQTGVHFMTVQRWLKKYGPI